MDQQKANTHEYVAKLVERCRIAQAVAEHFEQEKVDEIVKAVTWAVVKEENAIKYAKLAYEESGMGDIESKLGKLRKKPRGLLRELNAEKSVGVVEVDQEKGLMKIIKPVGTIGALVPCTNPEVTPVINGMCGLKGRNAVLFSPHPKTRKTTFGVVELMRSALEKHGTPADLLVCAEDPTIEMSKEIMRQCDLVIATGGPGMVRAAYSSGTPAYGVGAGNGVVVVDETADCEDAAHKIMLSKTNDLASGCSSENSLLIHKSIYEKCIKALRSEGGYLTSHDEKESLQRIMWVDGRLNKDIIAQPVKKIAALAHITIPEYAKFLMVPEVDAGPEYPFSGEKLSLVLTIYQYTHFETAIEIINKIHSFSGAGHSCGIHSFSNEHILQLSLRTKTGRVMVRQPLNYGNSGDWCNGMPWTVSLGCGTWGGNIISENITFKHYINQTLVSIPIKRNVPTDEELFGDIMHTD